MPEVYLRTGQAAEQLGIKEHHLRKLCNAGLIEADKTEGRQWRVPLLEIERLKKEGVPPCPVGLAGKEDASAGRDGKQTRPGAALLAAPSSAVVEAAEDAVISENELRTRRNKVEKLKLSQEATQIGDFFRSRRQREADDLAARRRQEQEEREERDRELQRQQAADQRREWTNEKISYALSQKPRDAPDTVRLAILEQVQQCLKKLAPTQPDYITEPLIDAAVECALAPWKKGTVKQKAIEDAVDRLDYYMKYDPVWKSRALEAAAAAIEKLRDGADRTEMETAGKAALQPLILEYEHSKKCRELVSNVWKKLRNETPEERQEAQDAMREVLAELPISTSQRQLEQAHDAALLPIQERIDERLDRERSEKAARLDEASRQAALAAADSNLPWGISDQLKQGTLELLREAINGLPAGTSRADLDQACARIVESAKKAHERHQQKESLIDGGLSEIFRYILRLEKEYDFDKGTYTLADEIREPIRKALWEELNGKETPEQVAGIVRRLVRAELVE